VTVPVPVPLFATVKEKVWRVKVAVTDLAASIVTMQLPVPVHPPDHPVKLESKEGVAVSVTVAPLLNEEEQVMPQLIPAGLLSTVPVPVPAFVTERLKVCKLKVAVTDLAASMVTAHVPVPVQAPLQPAKLELAEGVAVNVTEAPALKDAEQVVPQSIPMGEEVTVPVPVPALETERLNVCKLNVAVTDLAASIETEQVPVPVQAPDHPVKVALAAGAAVNVTAVPMLKVNEQVAPQLIPAGEEVTVPIPFPVFETERVNV
jgi:hypothetical protein